jgi:MraZ protein
MLIGEYQHNIDAKGRIIMPSRFREDLGDGFILTKGLDNCLFVYPKEEGAVLVERIKALPLSKSRDLQRFLFAGAAEVEPDKQGRIVIPANLREYAGLDRDITVIGATPRAEIWDSLRWKERVAGLTAGTIAEAMSELGF